MSDNKHLQFAMSQTTFFFFQINAFSIDNNKKKCFFQCQISILEWFLGSCSRIMWH